MRAFASFVLAALVSPAMASVVNFNGYTPLYDFDSSTIVSEGFSFSVSCTQCMGVDDRPPETVGGDPLPGAYNGTASLLYSTDPLSIMAVGGASFFLDQLDLGLSYYVPDSDVGGIATVSYVLAGGGSGSVDIALGRSYSTVAIGQEVLSVTISGGRTFGYVSLDNLVVNTNRLPEPESAALAVMALLGAGLATRRRQASA